MNEIKVNMDNLSESEREILMGLIEKSNKSKKRWKAEEDERYWYIGNDGNLYDGVHGYSSCDDDRYNFRNMFKTKEEAEFELEKRKVKIELQDFADENNKEIDYGKDYFYVLKYNAYNKELTFDRDGLQRESVTCFSDAELVQQAIEKIGEERIIKYLFNGGE